MKKKKSLKTTVAGVLALIVVVCSAIGTLLDDNPETNPDYDLVGSAFLVAYMGLVARDNNVSSEEAGVK